MDSATVAREYVLLGLRCDRLFGGLIEASPGMVALRRQVDNEPEPSADELARRAEWLRGELPSSELDAARRDFLDRQLVALTCLARRLAGAVVPYRAELRAYFDVEVEPGEPDRYRAAHRELAELLPGSGSLAARLAGCRAAEEVPVELVGPAVRALSGALRARTRDRIELPAEESVDFVETTDRPWSAFNQYLGACRSRILVNTDIARRASGLPKLVAHEAYPGHHTERCRRELALVERLGWLEQGVFVSNTPQALLSEGLADLGLLAAVGPGWGRWAQRVLAGPSVRVQLDGELAERVERAMRALLPVRQDAALLLHDRGRDPDEVVDYLSRWLLIPQARAGQLLRFLVSPRWRAYTTAYIEGYRLLSAWLTARPAGQPALDRLVRVFDEPLTPSALRAELARSPLGTAPAG